MGWYHTGAFLEEMQANAEGCGCSGENNGGNDGAAAANTTTDTTTTPPAPLACPINRPPTVPKLDTTKLTSIYHLCLAANWQQAVRVESAYFPPTFVKDGRFTRASMERESLVDTANHYYADSPGEWICLEIDAQLVLKLGLQILLQCAPEGTLEKPIQCLQVFGGIATTIPGLVTNIYMMKRGSKGEFLSMDSTPTEKIPKLAKSKHEAPAAPKQNLSAVPPSKNSISTTPVKSTVSYTSTGTKTSKKVDHKNKVEQPKEKHGKLWFRRGKYT